MGILVNKPSDGFLLRKTDFKQINFYYPISIADRYIPIRYEGTPDVQYNRYFYVWAPTASSGYPAPKYILSDRRGKLLKAPGTWPTTAITSGTNEFSSISTYRLIRGNDEARIMPTTISGGGKFRITTGAKQLNETSLYTQIGWPTFYIFVVWNGTNVTPNSENNLLDIDGLDYNHFEPYYIPYCDNYCEITPVTYEILDIVYYWPFNACYDDWPIEFIVLIEPHDYLTNYNSTITANVHYNYGNVNTNSSVTATLKAKEIHIGNYMCNGDTSGTYKVVRGYVWHEILYKNENSYSIHGSAQLTIS